MHRRTTIALAGVLLCGALQTSVRRSPAEAAPAAPVPALQGPAAKALPDVAELTRLNARLAPAELMVSVAQLPAGERAALVKLIQAARIIDLIFLDQHFAGSRALYQKLRSDPTPLGTAQAAYFWVNKGPFSELDGHTAFVGNVPGRKPLGANFYPEGLTRAEFEHWLQTLPEPQRKLASGFFSVIRSDGQGRLQAVPYSQAYKADLERCAALLREAAALTGNATLRTFLQLRAQAFATDDYYASDVAWMELDGPIDLTIGPYETYNDELLGYKAAFAAYLNVRDEAESQKVAAFSRHLQELEDHLPIDKQYKNPRLGAAAPIRVVNELLGAGDGNHGVQTAAYNLPNDERITTERGTKRVMLKNVQEAKFRKVLVPIAAQVLAPASRSELSFDWFFSHILAHELTHGIGPHQIHAGGQLTTPREQLKEFYSAIEEAKADVVGLYALQYLLDHKKELGLHGVLPTGNNDGNNAERQLYVTYLASSTRSLRFGLHEAHAQGTAIQVNHFLDHGGIVVQADGTLAIELAKMKEAVRSLAHQLLMIEATGDYAQAKQLLTERTALRPAYTRLLHELTAIPVDIRPVFVTADELSPQTP